MKKGGLCGTSMPRLCKTGFFLMELVIALIIVTIFSFIFISFTISYISTYEQVCHSFKAIYRAKQMLEQSMIARRLPTQTTRVDNECTISYRPIDLNLPSVLPAEIPQDSKTVRLQAIELTIEGRSPSPMRLITAIITPEQASNGYA